MTHEILNKNGYKWESNGEKIIIKSSRRISEFLLILFVTILILYTPIQTEFKTFIQYLALIVLTLIPISILFFRWIRRVEIQKGKVKIKGTTKGEIENCCIQSIDIKTEQSAQKRKITVFVNDSDKGLNKLFVISIKPEEMKELNELVDCIRMNIGINRVTTK
ncbi:hypothetical protein I0P70_13740 [Pontibacter sp. FD36]|uniref:hypothetical protein n=1 Tax=Pontibacter sp. FD36 TaxID=2789860 RepID=UPI0018AC2B0A|nr:hypothetical protein [Pontibacter sp. FD36]MBF8964311.1 hypothetical protein [Pontibacter sp. FD36]